ncbi:MAG: GNAT family N-acetyltransferase [Nanoarchaeota archaeon]|nr:GNAT family N-acetyltransferase [Nanoarchaeota archaeon]
MIQTLNRHVKYRKDNGAIFICDCKRLLDLKIEFKHEDFMRNLFKGIDEKKLNEKEKTIFSDFEKMDLLSELKIRGLAEKDFSKAMDILDRELGEKRVRDRGFLHKKFKEFPKFFIGLFLDKDLVGVICGFPREDYLLMSEIAVDSRFHGRDFGKRLVNEFERRATGFKIIKAGAQDDAITFYKKIGYKPFLLIQVKKKDYKEEGYRNFKKIKEIEQGDYFIIEAKATRIDKGVLQKYRKDYPLANFQFIFQKSFSRHQ